MGMPQMPQGPMPPMGGPAKPPNTPMPEDQADQGGGQGLEGIDPALIQQLMEILGIDPNAGEDEIVNIIQTIMSGQGIEPGGDAGPPMQDAAARRLGGKPQPPMPGGPPPQMPSGM